MNPHQRYDAKERTLRAKIQLLLHDPFFGLILTSLKVVWTKAIPTGATDGHNLYLNEDYVQSKTDAELKGLIAEEVLHVALGHCLRRGQREPRRWNIAIDYVIGHLLIDAGYVFGPECVIEKDRVAKKYHGMSAEVIYDMLPDEPPEQQPQGGGQGPGQPDPNGIPQSAMGDQSYGDLKPSGGQVIDAPEVKQGEAAVRQAEQEIKLMVHQAAMAQQAKMKGTMPAWMKTMIDEMMEPKVPWVDLLRRFFTAQFPADYTWARPNRRYVSRGIYLPGVVKEGIGELVIYWDSSGSCISEWPQFAGEVNYIIEDLHPTRVHLIQCDAAVGSFVTLEQGESLPLEVVGGGGSDFRPAFAAVEEAGIRPVAAIVLSDMYIDFPPDAPDYPVLLVSTTDTPGPDWGTEHIRMN